jgi:hypothetical protein
MKRSRYANEAEVIPQDRPALDSIAGREDDQGAEPGEMNADDVRKPVGARPARGEDHPLDLDDDETVDGLNPEEEAVRRRAEDTPSGETPSDPPVFDRGQSDSDL